MWNTGHIDRSYDDSVVQQIHMTTADYQPSTETAESYFVARAIDARSPHNAPGYYPTALSVGGATEPYTGLQSQPRALYRSIGSQAFRTNEYGSGDGPPEPTEGATFVASRSGSYDSSFTQSLTPESTQINAYNYMCSQGRGAADIVTSPPALSPTAGNQHHHRKGKVATRGRKTKHSYQGFSPESLPAAPPPAITTTTGNRSKLRSASRTSKNTHHNPPASMEERKSRETHNNVEKQYRNRLNAHFESLLSALPERMQSGEDGEGPDALDSGDRRVSKAEVLEMARRYIKALERECAALEGERDELRHNMEKVRWLFGRCEGSSGGQEGAPYLDPTSMA
ncbi:hypothetical protein GGS20DRAFT_298788 [Poronia punctata]|nr:hypothetical protein GGS20DRAFT_298788 [Poronia punctata]